MKKTLTSYFLHMMKYSFKLALVQCLTLTVLWAADLPAQNVQSVKDVKIDLNLQDVSVIQALKVIESKTEFRFTYDGNFLLDNNQYINLRGRNQMVYDYLKDIATQAGLSFRQYNNLISVKKERKKAQEESVEVIIQSRVVSGKILAEDTGEGLPGVNVVEKGTSNGTVTDIQGNFSLEVSEGATLVFSSVGYISREVPVGERTVIDLTMQNDVTQLEELVVIGYGTQQAKDLTSAIARVDAKEIVATPTSNPMQALQGRVPGVQIVSSGTPGQGPTVRVRGVGTIVGNSSPLYVVDGVFYDNIDFLNPSDIEDISVLKDASAAAIYGVRASNGVVLVETKSGKFNKKTEIVYDGYYGIQRAQNVLQLANTEQFVNYIDETGDPADISFVDNAMQRFGRSRINPDLPDVNTDWYNEILQTGPIQNHSLSISGGTENVRYSVGGNYFKQDGLLRVARNQFERYNLRGKLDFNANEWLNVGLNLNLSNANQYVAEEGVWFRSYFAVPILPVMDQENENASPLKIANAQLLGYRGTQNPFFDLHYNDNRNSIFNAMGNAYLNFEIIPDKLSFNTTYNYKLINFNSRNVDFRHNDGLEQQLYAIRKENRTTLDGIWDNVLTYEENFDRHNLTLMAGYSFRSETFQRLFARGTGDGEAGAPQFGQEELWYISQTDLVDIDNVNDEGGKIFGTSYIGRFAYNYDNRYYLYSTIRREGSNRFQKKWETFPVISAGWVLSEESFFDFGFVDFLKLRGGWGKLGNDGVPAAVGAPSLSQTNTAINDVLVPGRTVNYVFDLLDRWETTVETNIGLSAIFLNDRLSLEADYFIRDTENAVTTIILPLIRDNVRRNLGEIRNAGLEVALNWSDNISSDFSYTIGGNFATLRNEVLNLGGQPYLDAGQAEFRQRYIIGQPLQAFYGYEVSGVFQNQTDIDNSGYNEDFIATTNLKPGDFFFKDQNEDGVIDDLDRVVLGSFLPDLTYGFNFGFNWKNLEFNALFQGQTGHQILDRKRGEVIFTTDTNIDAELADNLWRGEGTSNTYPSAAGLRRGWNQDFSDEFVEDGSYFRIQNVRVAYSFLENDLLGLNLPDARLTFTAERPLTVFNYNGFNPEVPNGVDRQTYPVPAIYTLGLNVTL